MRPVVVVGVRDRRSLPTLVWAADEAAARGGEVVVVHAFAPPLPVPELTAVPPTDDGPWLAELVEREWCGVLRVRCVPHRVVAAPGPVPAVLRHVATDVRASLLVVGRGKRRRWPFKATSRRLAGASPCPVVVVPGLGEGVPSWLFTADALTGALRDVAGRATSVSPSWHQ